MALDRGIGLRVVGIGAVGSVAMNAMTHIDRRNAECRWIWYRKYCENIIGFDPWPPVMRELFDRDFMRKRVEARKWLKARFADTRPQRATVIWTLAQRRQARMGR